MAKFGSNDLAIALENTSGASSTNISQYIQEFNGIEIELLTEEVTSFGDTFVENASTGLRKINDIVLKGFYDNDANGPDTFIYGGNGGGGLNGTPRTMKVTYNAVTGSSGSWRQHSLDVILVSWKVMPSTGELTKFEAVFRPSETTGLAYSTGATSLT